MSWVGVLVGGGDRAPALEGCATLKSKMAQVNLIVRMTQVAAMAACRSEDALVSTYGIAERLRRIRDRVRQNLINY